MRNKRKGAFTLYFSVIFMSILLIGLTMVDFARMNVYKAEAQRAMEMSSNSLVTQYDKSFQHKYGLFMSKNDKLKEKANFLLAENFSVGEIDESNTEIQPISMNAAETKEQIIEYMKYRGPLVAANKLYSMFSSIKGVLSSGKKFSKRLETAESNADFLEALNDYRYTVEGWSFSPDSPDYIYMIKQGDGYFVRSLTDLSQEANNPYSPYINLNDTSLFRNAVSDMKLEQYIGLINSTSKSETARFLSNELGNLPEIARRHDIAMLNLSVSYKKIPEGDANKEKKEERKNIISEELFIHPELKNLADVAIEDMPKINTLDYSFLRDSHNLIDACKILKGYAKYYAAKPPETEDETLDTDWLHKMIEFNNALIKDKEAYSKCIIRANIIYKILESSKLSNKISIGSLKKISQNLTTYSLNVEKEINELKDSDSGQDADYAAAILPQLENKQEMIAIMKDRVANALAQNTFSSNVEHLKTMQQKLLKPRWDTDYFDYYQAPFNEEISVQSFRNNIFDENEMGNIENIKKYLNFGSAEKIKSMDPGEKFDESGFKEELKSYQNNCKDIHIDFSKEQLFVNKSDINNKDPKEEAKSKSASLRDLLKIAKGLFKNIFSFEGKKKLTDEEFQKLPSNSKVKATGEGELDDSVFGGGLGGIRAVRKVARSIKSWLKAIDNVVQGFKELAGDPLSTIYVNEYIMNTFNSDVTGKGVYKNQKNLKFQKKKDNPSKDKLKLDSELEYVIMGNKSDKNNNKGIAMKILALRVLPNALYIFTHSETSSLAGNLAAAITAIFPPLYFVVYILIVILWAILESLVDVFVLRQGQKVAFLKGSGDFILAPSGFEALAELFKMIAKAAIDKVGDGTKDFVKDSLDVADEKITEKAKEAKEYVKKKTSQLADKMEVYSQEAIDKIQDYVSAKYKVVDGVVSEAEKSLDNYINAAVGSYLVKIEQQRKKLGEYIATLDKLGLDVNDLFDTDIKKAVKKVAEANLGKEEVMEKVNNKLKELLNKNVISGSGEILDLIKKDGAIKDALNKKLKSIRTAAENKLEEYVFQPIEKELTEKKDEIKANINQYFDEKMDQGTEQLQEFCDQTITNIFGASELITTSTTEKSNSGFKLGYEDYLRIFLLFANENDKLFRVLDIIQLRENKEISGYMAGVEMKAGFDVKYLFLPRLIEIAKKQSSSISFDEEDYTHADFKLRTVAGY